MTYMAIIDSGFVTLMTKYYEDLWAQSKDDVLKMGQRLNSELIESIKVEVKRS